MKTFAFACILLVLSACASSPEPSKLHEQSEREKLYQVVELCQRLAVQHLKNAKYTNCRISKERIHFVFADQATYTSETQPVSSMVQTYCFASQGAAQRSLKLSYSWYFTKEKRGMSRSCPVVDFVQSPPEFGHEDER